MCQPLSRIFGTYAGDFGFAEGEIYIGELSNEIHAEVSYCSIGAMHEKVRIGRLTETSVDFILDLNNVNYPVHLKYGGDNLIGSFMFLEKEIPLHFKKTNNTYEFSEPYAIIPQQYVKILRKNHSYEKKDKSVKLTYELNNHNVLSYLHEIGIETENKHDLSTVKELLKQFCMKIYQDGVNYTHSKKYGTVNQIKYALSHKSFTNCRGMAIIFSGILRAYGFKSSYVTCLPYNQSDEECHVVCEVYVDELEKFIFIDPSCCVYFMRNNVILNLLELRECIQNSEEVMYYRDSSYNKESFDLIGYLGYFSKNIFQFVKCIDNCEKKESGKDNSICFVPIEYQEMVRNKYKVFSSNINDYYQH